MTEVLFNKCPSLMAQLVKNPLAMWETWVQSLGWEDPLEKGTTYPLQYSGRENSTDCIVHEVTNSQTWLSDFHFHLGFPGVLEAKASACSAGDPGSMPELGRSPGEGNGNPLQSFCLENPMVGGSWEAAVYGVAKSWTRLSDFTSSLA